MAEHFGVQKTLEFLARRYYWPLAGETKKILQEAGNSEGDDPSHWRIPVNGLKA